MDWVVRKRSVKESIPKTIDEDDYLEGIVDEKLSLVDENYLIDVAKKWLVKQSYIMITIFSILFVFLFLVIHSQNSSISNAVERSKNMEVVASKLTKAVSESSLNTLFESLYNSAIHNVKSRVDVIIDDITKEHKAMINDYNLIQKDYETMQQQMQNQTRLIQEMREEIELLKGIIEDYHKEVQDLHSRVLYDGTDLVDYAYEKNGGSVLTGQRWTSLPPDFVYSSSDMQQADPSLAINPPTEKGFCYPMDSSTPYYSVKIQIPRNPTVFSIDHISRFVTDNRASAPKKYEVWGFITEKGNPVLLARNCYYDISKNQTQFCYSSYKGDSKFSIFQLRILENWGAEFTCLYRFRVH